MQFKEAEALVAVYREKFPGDPEEGAWLCGEYAGDFAGIRSLGVFINDYVKGM